MMKKKLLKQWEGLVTAWINKNDFQKARFKISIYYLLLVFLVLNIFIASFFFIISKESNNYENKVNLYFEKREQQIYFDENTKFTMISIEPKIIHTKSKDDFLEFHKIFVEILKKWLFELEFLLLVFSSFLAYYFAGLSMRPIEEKDKKQKELISNISHELKNPLAGIKMSLEVSKKQKDWKKGEVQEVFQDLENEISRLIKITDDLVSLEKLGIKKKKNIDVYKVLKKVLKSLKSFSQKKNIDFIERVEEEVFWKVNQDDLEKIFFNLIHNAIKFSKMNSKIEIVLNKKEFKVKDFGVGIKKEDLKDIFERFYKIDNSRKLDDESGSGLGLSIVKELVEKNDLKIRVKSKFGSWTEFKVFKD